MIFFAAYKRWFEIAAIGAVIIGVLWAFHSWSEKQREKGREEIRIEWREAEVKRIEAENKLLAAQNAVRDLAKSQGEEREKTINAAVAISNASAISLRSALTSQQTQLATASIETARHYSAVASAVFTECTEENRWLAAEAERNANAARTLSDAWPTVPAASK